MSALCQYRRIPLISTLDNRAILDVFQIDFRDRSTTYYVRLTLVGRREPIFAQEYAIKEGAIRLNGEIVPPDTILKNADLISNCVHRHEPPVTAAPVKIIFRDDEQRRPHRPSSTRSAHDWSDLLVVEKPGSIPVHVSRVCISARLGAECEPGRRSLSLQYPP
jgi:23S rRNA-/tRNA-specific pseudouridylate synthase